MRVCRAVPAGTGGGLGLLGWGGRVLSAGGFRVIPIYRGVVVVGLVVPLDDSVSIFEPAPSGHHFIGGLVQVALHLIYQRVLFLDDGVELLDVAYRFAHLIRQRFNGLLILMPDAPRGDNLLDELLLAEGLEIGMVTHRAPPRRAGRL